MILALLLVALAFQPTDEELCYAHKAAPADVQAFMVRAADCNHWGGEEPYDAARRREINKAVAELRCTALSGDEKRLRGKYARNQTVLNTIDISLEAYAWPVCKAVKR